MRVSLGEAGPEGEPMVAGWHVAADDWPSSHGFRDSGYARIDGHVLSAEGPPASRQDQLFWDLDGSWPRESVTSSSDRGRGRREISGPACVWLGGGLTSGGCSGFLAAQFWLQFRQ